MNRLTFLFSPSGRTLRVNPRLMRLGRTLLILFLAVSPAWAQIAFDAGSNSGAQGTASSYSWSHTCTGSDLVLVVGVSIRHNTVTVTGITYNGIALTQIRTDGRTSLTYSEIWFLKAPATGSNTIAVTLSGGPTRSISGAVSLTGVDQTTPNDADNGATGSSTTPSASVTTVADNAWIVDVVAVRTGSSETITVGSGQTQRWNVLDGANGLRAGGSHEGPVTPAGATTMDWTISASKAWALSAAAFKPVAAARRLMIITHRCPPNLPAAAGLPAVAGKPQDSRLRPYGHAFCTGRRTADSPGR